MPADSVIKVSPGKEDSLLPLDRFQPLEIEAKNNESKAKNVSRRASITPPSIQLEEPAEQEVIEIDTLRIKKCDSNPFKVVGSFLYNCGATIGDWARGGCIGAGYYANQAGQAVANFYHAKSKTDQAISEDSQEYVTIRPKVGEDEVKLRKDQIVREVSHFLGTRKNNNQQWLQKLKETAYYTLAWSPVISSVYSTIYYAGNFNPKDPSSYIVNYGQLIQALFEKPVMTPDSELINVTFYDCNGALPTNTTILNSLLGDCNRPSGYEFSPPWMIAAGVLTALSASIIYVSYQDRVKYLKAREAFESKEMHEIVIERLAYVENKVPTSEGRRNYLAEERLALLESLQAGRTLETPFAKSEKQFGQMIKKAMGHNNLIISKDDMFKVCVTNLSMFSMLFLSERNFTLHKTFGLAGMFLLYASIAKDQYMPSRDKLHEEEIEGLVIKGDALTRAIVGMYSENKGEQTLVLQDRPQYTEEELEQIKKYLAGVFGAPTRPLHYINDWALKFIQFTALLGSIIPPSTQTLAKVLGVETSQEDYFLSINGGRIGGITNDNVFYSCDKVTPDSFSGAEKAIASGCSGSAINTKLLLEVSTAVSAGLIAIYLANKGKGYKKRAGKEMESDLPSMDLLYRLMNVLNSNEGEKFRKVLHEERIANIERRAFNNNIPSERDKSLDEQFPLSTAYAKKMLQMAHDSSLGFNTFSFFQSSALYSIVALAVLKKTPLERAYEYVLAGIRYVDITFIGKKFGQITMREVEEMFYKSPKFFDHILNLANGENGDKSRVGSRSAIESKQALSLSDSVETKVCTSWPVSLSATERKRKKEYPITKEVKNVNKIIKVSKRCVRARCDDFTSILLSVPFWLLTLIPDIIYGFGERVVNHVKSKVSNEENKNEKIDYLKARSMAMEGYYLGEQHQALHKVFGGYSSPSDMRLLARDFMAKWVMSTGAFQLIGATDFFTKLASYVTGEAVSSEAPFDYTKYFYLQAAIMAPLAIWLVHRKQITAISRTVETAREMSEAFEKKGYALTYDTRHLNKRVQRVYEGDRNEFEKTIGKYNTRVDELESKVLSNGLDESKEDQMNSQASSILEYLAKSPTCFINEEIALLYYAAQAGTFSSLVINKEKSPDGAMSAFIQVIAMQQALKTVNIDYNYYMKNFSDIFKITPKALKDFTERYKDGFSQRVTASRAASTGAMTLD